MDQFLIKVVSENVKNNYLKINSETSVQAPNP